MAFKTFPERTAVPASLPAIKGWKSENKTKVKQLMHNLSQKKVIPVLSHPNINN